MRREGNHIEQGTVLHHIRHILSNIPLPGSVGIFSGEISKYKLYVHHNLLYLQIHQHSILLLCPIHQVQTDNLLQGGI